MARKKLIPGANAARVEERIARAPVDVDGPSIFQILRGGAQEQEAPRAPAPAPRPKRKPQPARPTKISPTPKTEAVPEPPYPRGRAGRAAITLSGEERVVLVKACTSYRNSLPTYLRSVQREVTLIDGLIGRLSGRQSGPGKSTGP